MVSIVCYSYDAAYHCVACTRKRFAGGAGERDENGVPMDAVDSEGNPVHPVFSTDETPADISPDKGGYTVTCDDCFEVIAENEYEQLEA